MTTSTAAPEAAPPVDKAHLHLPPPSGSEVEHRYGHSFHLVADIMSYHTLALLGHPDTVQPAVNEFVKDLYHHLLRTVIAREFPTKRTSVNTRMKEHTPAGVWTGPILDPTIKVVSVALARAGLLPSQTAFDLLTRVLPSKNIRQDHLHIGRTTNDVGAVTGAGVGGAKIGGSIAGSVVLIPDPMGATGSTVSQVLKTYDNGGHGQPLKTVALHLIVTPEYLRHMRDNHPDVIVYALRVDRGLSSAEVLECMPGERWDEERGLTDHQYIVPGAGGLGEVMNNAWV